MVWKHRFVCLSAINQEKIPTSTKQKELKLAGLGEKLITMSILDLAPEGVSEILMSSFPKLEDGSGFELCQCTPNTRTLSALPTELISSVILLKRRVKNSRTYIRPIQRNLDLTRVVAPELKQMCFSCLTNISLNLLKHHLSNCDGKREEHQHTADSGEDSN